MKKCFSLIVSLCFLCRPFCFAEEFELILKRFEAYAEKSLQDWNAVGMSIGIVKDEKVIYTKGFGQRSLQDKQAVTPDTLFQVGSISKAFTTALTAIAADRSLIKWEDAVIDHLPDFMLLDPWVTRQCEIEDLYSQRSGLPPYVGDAQALLGFPIEKIIHNIRFFQPITSFRSQFAYQNIFFSIGAKILEKITGKPWNTLLEEEIFKPLGMKGSSSSLQAYLKANNRAGWHLRKPDGKIIQIPDNFEAADWVYLYGPAGGINSSAKEMANWLILQANQGIFYGKRIISKENLARTGRPYIYIGERYGGSNFYCLGWIFLEYSPFPIIWHNGGTSGANNNIAFIPQDKLGIVVLCNTRETLLAEALTMQFFDMFYGKEDRDWSKKLLDEQKEREKELQAKNLPLEHPLPALPLQNYSGVYVNEVYGNAKVDVDGEHLKIVIGPKQTIWTLKHFNKDAFSLWWPPEESKVFFYFDTENKPSKMVIEMLQGDGQGTFIKKE